MKFNDEFEYYIDDKIFIVEVEGVVVVDEYEDVTTFIDRVNITDDSGNEVDEHHPLHYQIYTHAIGKEYEVEIHNESHSYYDDINSIPDDMYLDENEL
jgi:hypothetical protein